MENYIYQISIDLLNESDVKKIERILSENGIDVVGIMNTESWSESDYWKGVKGE